MPVGHDGRHVIKIDLPLVAQTEQQGFLSISGLNRGFLFKDSLCENIREPFQVNNGFGLAIVFLEFLIGVLQHLDLSEINVLFQDAGDGLPIIE